MPADMAAKMKRIDLQMNLLMGITMSFFLSLTGNLVGMASSGRFSVIDFLIGFAVSTLISIVLGLIVPVRKVTQAATKNMAPGFAKSLVSAFLTDLIYTPLMTLIMVFLAWRGATAHNPGAAIPFLPMFLTSLAVCMAAGLILAFVFTPLYLKMILKRNGVPMGPGGPGGLGGPGGPGAGPA